MMIKTSLFIAALSSLPLVAHAQDPSFSSGLAETINDGLLDCGSKSRESAVGQITADDGTVWIVPAATNYETATHAADLHNECSDYTPGGLSDIDLDTVPIIDAGGSEEFTAYIFADNYFELYVNGSLLVVDPVPFTLFNSNVVRFKADRPVSIAIMGVDWEENLGLGSENGRGSAFAPGDAGIVAQILGGDGTVAAVTDSSWQAQTYYVSPLSTRDCLMIEGNVRDSSSCDTSPRDSAEGLSAAFWPIPDGWEQSDFDASAWPNANIYSNKTVGVDNKPAFTNFTEIFDDTMQDPEFIWSSNLILDNLVLLRKTIE